MSIKLLGLEIDRKTDVIAFVALIISLITALYQLTGFLQGPRINLFAPDSIVIIKHDYGDNIPSYMKVNARMAYTNTGQVGFNAVVKNEYVEFTLGNKKFKHHWQYFENYDSPEQDNKSNSPDDQTGKSGLIRFNMKPALPFPVNSGSAKSHETTFFPRLYACPTTDSSCSKARNFLKWDDFILELEHGLETQKSYVLKFILFAEIYGNPEPLRKTCKIEIDKDNFIYIKKDGWATISCVGEDN